jgi:signal transduction histidine kinase
MVTNPSIEVYLLDTEGNIITYVAPYKKVKLDKVNLEPVKQFIAADEKPFIKGDDPRHPNHSNVFSAAPILENDNLLGYFYIILASEEQAEVTSMLSGSYMLKLGSNMFFIALIGALIIGLLAIWFLTRNLRNIIDTVRRFKEGDLQARVAENNKGEMVVLADTFNDMADTIVTNIDELKSVENLRKELIANVSHDLRTPLAIQQGYVETLLMKEESISPEKRKEYLEIVLNSSEKLSGLIAQLFEYSKLEAKQIQPSKEPFFITELAQDIFQKYQILAADKKINMKLDMSPDLPMVFADVGLVERVIQNLMDNALKFTPEGGEVTITLEEMDKTVEVKIADTGPGIPENEQSFIFERYRQSERVNNEKQQGAGLGLAIVKKILELHDATIRVNSRLNEGTTFLFQLPAYSG